MGTKNNPGKFDCYANAKPDEPMFVLLGRDPSAALLVKLWADLREETGDNSVATNEQIADARRCAEAMQSWARAQGKSEEIVKRAFASFVGEFVQEVMHSEAVVKAL